MAHSDQETKYPYLWLTQYYSNPTENVGHGGRHLKLLVQSANDPTHRFEAIGFGMGDRIDEVRAWRTFDIVFTLAKNTPRSINS